MNATSRSFALAAVVALAACSDATAPVDATASAPSPVVVAPSPPAITTTIPDRFLGEWNTETAACGTDHPSRLVLDAQMVRFQQSTGPVTSVVDVGDDLAITVKLAGEGEPSDRSYRYRLGADGHALTDLDAALSRTRCPSPDRQVASN